MANAACRFEIVELTTLPRWRETLTSLYADLYLPSFPHPEEREELEALRQRLEPSADGDGGESGFSTLFLVARPIGEDGATTEETIAGLLIVECYTRSRCALLAYIAVSERFRGRGLGGQLMNAARAHTQTWAERSGGPLRGLFGEIHNPHDPSSQPHADSLNRYARIQVMQQFGARWVPIDYVAPALSADKPRLRNLLLMAFPTGRRPIHRLDTHVLRDFLADMYVGLGVDDPETDPDFRAMVGQRRERQLELRTLCAERSVFGYADYGIAMHFVVPAARMDHSLPENSAREFRSFEEDLLSYCYRSNPPFHSEIVELPERLRKLEVVFPAAIAYSAEGELKQLLLDCPDTSGLIERRVSVEVRATRTVFADPEGVTVYHLTLVPDHDVPVERSAVTEWDLVKLSKLWQGGEDATDPLTGRDLSSVIRFSRSPAAPGMTITELARDVFGWSGAISPRGGTVQILTCDPGGEDACQAVFESIGQLTEMEEIPPELDRQVKAVAGIVTGLLDFPFVDVFELADTFHSKSDLDESRQAFHLDGPSLIVLHKGTLLDMADDCRVYRMIEDSIGISPYILLPHAVLIYNGYLLESAAAAARKAGDVKPRELTRITEKMRDCLQGRFLQNVFHYPLERFLYSTGLSSRGQTGLKESLELQLDEIEKLWTDFREQQERRFERRLTWVALILALLQLLSLVDAFNPGTLNEIARAVGLDDATSRGGAMDRKH